MISAILSLAFPIFWLMLASVGIGGLVLLPLRDRLPFLAWTELTLAYFLGQALLASLFLCLALTGRLGFVEVTASLAVGSVGFIIYLWRNSALLFAQGAALGTVGECNPPSLEAGGIGGGCRDAARRHDAGRQYYRRCYRVLYGRAQGRGLFRQTDRAPGLRDFLCWPARRDALGRLDLPGYAEPDPQDLLLVQFLADDRAVRPDWLGQCGLAVRGRILAVVIPLTSSAVLVLWGSGKTDLFALGPALCAAVLALASWERAGQEGRRGLVGTVRRLRYCVQAQLLAPARAGAGRYDRLA